MREPLLVTVHWIDACHDATEMPREEIGKRVRLAPRRTDGRLTDIDEKRIVVSATTTDGSHEYDGHWAIPLGWIVKVVTARGRVIYKREP